MSIPSLIVGGFLGSGKTTFIINSILPKLSGKRIAIIVNDFGKINYDRIRLYQETMEVYGVEGGCFCCELGGEFLETIAMLKSKDLDLLVVETSGISDPSPIYYSLETSGYNMELIVGVFGLDMDEELLKTPLVQAQLEASHILVLTKADLLGDAQINKRVSFFSSHHKPIFLAREGLVEEDIQKLFGNFKEAPNLRGKHTDFRSLNITLDGFYSKWELEKFFSKLPKEVYRAKGIVYCLESPVPLGVNYSFGHLTWERLETEERPFLIFIGKEIERDLLKDFPKGGMLSIEHEKVCFPLEEFDAREDVAYYKGEAMDELEVAEKLWEELEKEDFLLISGEELSFRGFVDIKELCKRCQSSPFDKVVFWKVPSGVVSYVLKNLKNKLIYHLSKHFLLPKAHISLRVDTPAKEETILALIKSNAII
ncbi:CobW family GTP-binding protein [Thermocrinis sp.]